MTKLEDFSRSQLSSYKNWWRLGNGARPTWFQTWYQIASFLVTLSHLGGHFTYCKALQMQ